MKKLKILKLIVTAGALVYGYFLISAGLGFQLSSNAMATVVDNALSSMTPARERAASDSRGKGCNQMLLEKCASVDVPSTYLFDSDSFRKIIDAIEHPCLYLSNPNDTTARRDWLDHPNNESNWRFFRCASNEYRRIKVVININNEHGQRAFRFIKP